MVFIAKKILQFPGSPESFLLSSCEEEHGQLASLRTGFFQKKEFLHSLLALTRRGGCLARLKQIFLAERKYPRVSSASLKAQNRTRTVIPVAGLLQSSAREG